MEATATWAEDELYDDVDDNVQYLGGARASPSSRWTTSAGGASTATGSSSAT